MNELLLDILTNLNTRISAVEVDDGYSGCQAMIEELRQRQAEISQAPAGGKGLSSAFNDLAAACRRMKEETAQLLKERA
jgi:hypothetical protein